MPPGATIEENGEVARQHDEEAFRRRAPNLVQSAVTTVTTSADYARLIDSFKKTVRPFAICVITTPLEVK